MQTSKSTSKTAAELWLTPHEVRLLQSYFKRQTRPYLVALLLGVAILAVSSSIGLPMSAGDPEL